MEHDGVRFVEDAPVARHLASFHVGLTAPETVMERTPSGFTRVKVPVLLKVKMHLRY